MYLVVADTLKAKTAETNTIVSYCVMATAQLMTVLLASLITCTNCQSTLDEDGSCSSRDVTDGELSIRVLANQQKVIVNKLEAVEAALNVDRQPAIPSQNVKLLIDALKCKYPYLSS